jgi:phosphate transport system substrate-binding protein
MKTKTYQQTCPLCDYNCNPVHAKECEICQTPLQPISLNQNKPFFFYQGQAGRFYSRVLQLKSKFNSLSLGKTLFLGVVILGLGNIGLINLKNNFYSEGEPFLGSSKILNNRGDIELYDTMKAVPNVPKGLFTYGGAICFAALQRDGMNTAISNAHKDFRLRYQLPKSSNSGCTTGVDRLISQELSVAQNSRPLKNEEIAEASKRGFDLESVPVAVDGIIFYTNKSLAVKSLSIEQVTDIYLGKIKNWQEVGGVDLPIIPVSLDPKFDNILSLLMKTENENVPQIGKDVVITRDFTSAIRKTSSTPGSISYASSAILKNQKSIRPIALAADQGDSSPVSALLADGSVNLQAFEKNLYPFTRRLFVVIRRDGTPEEKAGVAYTNLLLSQEGQEIFQQAGFVPLYLKR